MGAPESDREQARRYTASGGTDAATYDGLPIVVVTTVGARSGEPRQTALMRVEVDGAYVAVASFGGAPRNPQWYANLQADPDVQVQDGSARGAFRAREVYGAERALWWRRAVEAYPTYATYQQNTHRIIPVVLLEPVGVPG